MTSPTDRSSLLQDSLTVQAVLGAGCSQAMGCVTGVAGAAHPPFNLRSSRSMESEGDVVSPTAKTPCLGQEEGRWVRPSHHF